MERKLAVGTVSGGISVTVCDAIGTVGEVDGSRIELSVATKEAESVGSSVGELACKSSGIATKS